MNKFQRGINKIAMKNYVIRDGLLSFREEKKALRGCHKSVAREFGVSSITLNLKDKKGRNVMNKYGEKVFR